jgi:hypothetical protein
MNVSSSHIDLSDIPTTPQEKNGIHAHESSFTSASSPVEQVHTLSEKIQDKSVESNATMTNDRPPVVKMAFGDGIPMHSSKQAKVESIEIEDVDEVTTVDVHVAHHSLAIGNQHPFAMTN